MVETRTTVMQFGTTANRRLFLADSPGSPNNLTDLVAQSPGVEKTGQSGLLQVFSIRGTSGQRVQTRFNGVPLATERRAGTAAAFVDPWLLQYVDVVRGPASVYFGSGAIGGAVLATPRFFDGIAADIDYQSGSTLRAQSLGLGNENWSFGISNRSAAAGEDPHGNPLHSGYQQTSALLQNRFTRGELQFRSSLLSSRGSDIGRSNALFPRQRIGAVAASHNDLLQFGMNSGKGWSAELYAHDQSTRNETLIIGSTFNRVSTSSIDWGGRLSSTWTAGAWSGEFGADLDSRDRVHADETAIDINSQQSTTLTNLSAAQKAYALFAVGSLSRGDHSFQVGLRQGWLQQDAVAAQRRSTRVLTGFAEWQWFLGNAWSVSAEVATAYRDPSLSERFFTGSTGRGDTIGNPALRQEQAPGLDLGLHWTQGRSSFSGHWFVQSFDSYIERTVIDSTTRSYGNAQEGTIQGIELEGETRWNERWAFDYGVHWIVGEDATGQPLADIPAVAARLGITYAANNSQAGLYWNHRLSNSRVAATEVAVDAADGIDLFYRHHLSASASLSLYVKNGLNDSYRISKDDISTRENQRTLGIRINVQFNRSAVSRAR